MEGDSVSPVVTDRDAPEPSAKHKSPRELHLQQDTDGENFFSDIEFEIDEEQFEETFNWYKPRTVQPSSCSPVVAAGRIASRTQQSLHRTPLLESLTSRDRQPSPPPPIES